MSILKTICSKKLDEVNFLKKKNFNKNKKIRCRGFLKTSYKKK